MNWRAWLVGFSTFAAIVSSAKASLFCVDPETSVCVQNRLFKTDREKRLDHATKKMRAQALLTTARDHLDWGDPADFSFADLRSLKPVSKQKKAQTFYYGQIRRGIETYIRDHQLPLDLNFEEVREAMLRITANHPDFSRAQAERVARRIRSAHFMTLSTSLVQMWGDSDSKWKLFQSECGEDALDDNAFADTWRDERIVVVCPGALIASVEFAKHYRFPLAFRATPLLMTLGHELSHHFDSDEIPEAYEDLQSCYVKRFSSHLRKDVSHYMAEISADHWGVLILADALKTLPFDWRERILVSAMEDLCGAKDDGDHPSGRFRLDFIAGRSPALREALQCPTKAPLSCPDRI